MAERMGVLIMAIDKIIVLLFSVLGVVSTYWFFLLKKDSEVVVNDSVQIIVDGGYTPSTISIQKNKSTAITFLRKDASSCLDEVVLSDFKIRKYLPLNKKVVIQLVPKHTGEFPFTCGMNMFHGKIIVV